MEVLKQPWPWYLAGGLIGLIVPALLILGNKSFGISSNLRHICAACLPANIPFFQYDWKKEQWNLYFLGGIVLGGILAHQFLMDPNQMVLNPALVEELKGYQIQDFSQLVPVELIHLDQFFTLRGFVLMVVGGFLVGFGTRYAGGCTSGHAIMGLSSLQWPSLVATISFMLGGFLMANFILPYLLTL